jgi:DNA-binding SARP family transcriptional activator
MVGAMSESLTRLFVLGAIDLRDRDGHEVTSVLAQPRRLALLTYLALAPAGEFQRRATLHAMFWPEADDAHARGALRQALSFLRRALGADALPARGDAEVRLATEGCACDAAAFEAALRAGDADTAVSLYRGDLLDGFHIDDAPAFDEWLERRRARLSREYEAALESVARRRAADGDHVAAAEFWQTLVDRTPGRCHAVAGLMQALGAIGNRAGALQAAARHQALLAREFGAAPDADILALAARLRGHA